MKYKEYGNKINPTIMLLHGELLSVWSFEEIAQLLENNYHVIIPYMPGHNNKPFISIDAYTKEIEEYIEKEYGGCIYAICGFSIGGQVLLNLLSRHQKICEYAVIESIDVFPTSGMIHFMMPMINASYTLFKQKWFAKLQADTMNIPYPMRHLFYQDIENMDKTSLTNIIKEIYRFTLPKNLKSCLSHTLILFGEKEGHSIKKSSQLICASISHSQLYQLKKMDHGEFSLAHPKHYVKLLMRFFKNN